MSAFGDTMPPCRIPLVSDVGLWRILADVRPRVCPVWRQASSVGQLGGTAAGVTRRAFGDLCAFLYGEPSCKPRLPLMRRRSPLRLAGMLSEKHHTCMNVCWSRYVCVSMTLVCAHVCICMMDLLLFWVVKVATPRASGGVAGGTIFGDGSVPGGHG